MTRPTEGSSSRIRMRTSPAQNSWSCCLSVAASQTATSSWGGVKVAPFDRSLSMRKLTTGFSSCLATVDAKVDSPLLAALPKKRCLELSSAQKFGISSRHLFLGKAPVSWSLCSLGGRASLPVPLQRTAHRPEQAFGAERLGKQIKITTREVLRHHARGNVPAGEQHIDRRIMIQQPLGQLEPGHARHDHVGEDQVEGLGSLIVGIQSLGTVHGRLDPIARSLKGGTHKP